MKPLFIEEIRITNFKNYSNTSFCLGPKFNLAFGLNGTGKTNLLDAIYYVCVGKSYFSPFDQKVVRYGESFFRIESDVVKEDLKHKVIIKVKPGLSKELSLDDSSLDRISDHLGFLPVVISAPKDIDLVFGPGQSRRRYVDHLLCQKDAGYLRSLVTYNHLLQMRNAALKQDFKDLKRIIETFDDQMNPHASYIYEKRNWLRNEILPLLQSNYKILSDDREVVDIQYESKLKEYPYLVLADMNWDADRNTRRSNAGIHKDDFYLSIKDMSAREYASQGQIKSLIFALHLSKFRVLSNHCGYQPILIFDDIFDKLDEHRLTRLMEMLMQSEFGQIMLSDTNRKRVGDFVPASLLNELQMSS